MESVYGVSSSTIICVRLFGPLEVSRRGPDGSWQTVKKEEWNQGTPPRSVLKRLLTTPGRHLSRVDIEDDLWPETDAELADRNLSNALMVIRRIIGKDLVETSGSLCGIADQSHVWTDLDACYTLLRAAENNGCTTAEALPFLEETHRYLARGKCLEDESETWCHAVRTDAERMGRQCHLWLAEGYELADKLWQAGEVYRVMTCTLPPDEEALQRWMQMLARHGKQRDALQWYQEHQGFFEDQGFSLPPLALLLPSLAQTNNLVPNKPPVPFPLFQVTMPLRYDLGERLVQSSLSPHNFLDSSLLDRLEHALSPRIYPTRAQLDHLLFEQKKRLVTGGSDWLDLLSVSSSHLRFGVSLIESHTGVDHFTSFIGETCLLLADILFNQGDSHTATQYYALAVRAAQENTTLRAIVLGRYSLLLIDSQHAREAVPFLEEALRLADRTASGTIRSWLWAVKGEAHAHSREEVSCLKALEAARNCLDQEQRETSYTFIPELVSSVFSSAKLWGYEGACYLHLDRPEDAQQVLAQSEQLSLHPHHQSLVMTDYALVLLQQREPQGACLYANRALDHIEQTRSTRALRRLLPVRAALKPWETLPEIRNFDEHFRLVAGV